MGTVGFDFLSAPRAFVLAVTGVRISDTYFSLKIPVASEDPGIAVGHASADKPALEASVFEFREISAEEGEVSVDSSDVVLAAVEMRTYKVACEAVAEPIASLRLQEPVLPALVVAESPGIELAGDVQCPFGGPGQPRLRY